jgi:hypothetical protein
MIRFVDLLYGFVELPEWIAPFIRLPEFIRLRGVRLSNVDSVFFKDFSGATRWEHGIAVASLAYRCSTRRGLSEAERVQLTLAGLLHDVGTPPFAHTAESVLANFDHEIEGQRLLEARVGGDFAPDATIYQSQLPQFHKACDQLSQGLGVLVNPDEVAKCILGEGDLGFLMNGPLDLDNADNVTRSALFLGLKVSADIPLRVTDWLADRHSVITDLDKIDDEAVRQWVSYRNQVYTVFFEADEGEMGRMAFLQHLMRRSLDAGMGRSQLIWSTDDGLLTLMSNLDDVASDDFRPALGELVQRYRLLETPECVGRVDISHNDTLRVLRHPDAVAWITKHLRGDGFEPMVLVMSRRFSAGNRTTLLPEPVGSLYVFHLGVQRHIKSLEATLQSETVGLLPKRRGKDRVSVLLSSAVERWCEQKPWQQGDEARKGNIVAALKSVGDWGFRLSRNDVFHAYPSTFVHALPANLLVSLGVREDMVLDPFGGTAQTALEALKYGNDCISADVNSIACLVAKARLSFLPVETREQIKRLDDRTIRAARCAEPPNNQLLDKWFHSRTTRELRHLFGFIEDLRDPILKTFLSACASAILPSCTARRGEQHGYFADNCPLPRDSAKPPYQPALQLFFDKLQQALSGVERLYAFLERQGRDVESELNRAKVRHVNILNATPESYGIQDGEVGAIITSPPYLCMADYALGQRLSYEWLSPTLLDLDFKSEIGARRLRLKNRPAEVIEQYCKALDSFASISARVLRKGGFLAVVLGQPVAQQYRDANVSERLEESLQRCGFEPLWQVDRPIHWHRNHGYARLKKERISVHVKI